MSNKTNSSLTRKQRDFFQLLFIQFPKGLSHMEYYAINFHYFVIIYKISSINNNHAMDEVSIFNSITITVKLF
jgi:hypothetical protein